MTKKKRELIEILLDNVKPEDWPKNFPFATQDIKSMNVDHPIYAYRRKPVNNSAFPERWNQSGYSTSVKIGATPKELCKHWNKTIVHRDEFMKRWNERNAPDEVKTPQQLALEKFGTDWHDNEGVQPVDDCVFIDAIMETGAVMRRYQWKALVLFKIHKWRVYSQMNITKQELYTEETKPIQQEVKATDTQIGGNHYTKLAIQPMHYSMANKLVS